MIRLTLTSILSILLPVLMVAQPCQPRRDSLALMDFYKSTKGNQWVNTRRDSARWMVGRPISNWYGVTVNSDGCVIVLSLHKNNLDSIIPLSIGNLTQLEELGLCDNLLKGTIPDSIYSLKNLRSLQLQENRNLGGSISSRIGDLKKLEDCYLFSNSLEGAIPVTIGQLTKLQTLHLADNRLTGTVPKELGNCLQMNHLDLSENTLSGKIPYELGLLTELTYLGLGDDGLTGAVPASFTNLTKLKGCNLSTNQLDSLPNMSRINFAYNTPDWFGFYVQDNNFTFKDIVPQMPISNRATMVYTPQDSFYHDTTFIVKNGDSLTINLGIDSALTSNSYQWYRTVNGQTIPYSYPLNVNKRTFARIDSAFYSGVYTCVVTNPNAPNLTLYSRKITIKVLPRYCRYKDSMALVALYNSTGGSNWTNKWNLAELVYKWKSVGLSVVGDSFAVASLSLGANNLSGTLPNEFKNCDELGYFYLSGNAISGSIPPSYGNSFRKLCCFQMDNNRLSGTFPNTFSGIPTLSNIELGNNRIDSFPKIEFNQPNRSLFLYGNRLTFDDLLPNVRPGYYEQFDNQDSIFRDTTIILKAGQPLSINLGIDGALTTNVYKWKKNGIDYTSLRVNQLNINSLCLADSGTYTCTVTNPTYSYFRLSSYPIRVKVTVGTMPTQNVSICSNQTYRLNSGRIVSNAGNYLDTIRSINHCDSIIYTVNVTMSSSPITSNQNAAICRGQTYTLPNGQIVSPTTTTTYKDTFRNRFGCDSLVRVVNLTVNATPSVSITGNTSFCKNSSVSLTATGGGTYRWDNNTTSATRTITAEGNYSVTVTSSNGCMATKSVRVIEHPLPIVHISEIDPICKGASIELIATSGFTNYAWSNGVLSFRQTVSPPLPTTYRVTVTDVNGCKGIDSVKVILKGDNSSIPNMITPNGDGKNDVFIIPNLDCFPNTAQKSLMIISRWEEVVYEAKPYDNNWGGTNQQGQDLPAGTYYYIARLNLADGDILTGFVTIVRE